MTSQVEITELEDLPLYDNRNENITQEFPNNETPSKYLAGVPSGDGGSTYSAASTLPIHSHPPVVEDIPLHSALLNLPGGLY